MSAPGSVSRRIRELLPASMICRLKGLRDSANRRPRLAVALLMGIAVANFGLLLLLSEHGRQQAFSYSAITPLGEADRKRGKRELSSAQIPFTLHNFLEVRAMKDSLALLMGKSHRSREDTLLFIRILERYARLDTAFARQLRTRQNQQKKTTH